MTRKRTRARADEVHRSPPSFEARRTGSDRGWEERGPFPWRRPARDRERRPGASSARSRRFSSKSSAYTRVREPRSVADANGLDLQGDPRRGARRRRADRRGGTSRARGRGGGRARASGAGSRTRFDWRGRRSSKGRRLSADASLFGHPQARAARTRVATDLGFGRTDGATRQHVQGRPRAADADAEASAGTGRRPTRAGRPP